MILQQEEEQQIKIQVLTPIAKWLALSSIAASIVTSIVSD